MIQLNFEIDSLAKALMEVTRGGSWEHWCDECEHPDHYYMECEHEGCKCISDGGYDPKKSGPIPWDKLPDHGDRYEYGERRVKLGIKGKDYWRDQAWKLVTAL